MESNEDEISVYWKKNDIFNKQQNFNMCNDKYFWGSIPSKESCREIYFVSSIFPSDTTFLS